MNLLAFDTSTEFLSLALKLGDNTTTQHLHTGNASSQLILPQIQILFDAANIKLKNLHGIAFGAGPGAFTGVRVACGVAQGLGFGANLPVVGVNTLMALAEASGHRKVITCLDARMGEIYHAAFIKEGADWLEVSESKVCKPEGAPELDGTDWIAAGSGWAVYGEALSAIYAQNLSPNLALNLNQSLPQDSQDLYGQTVHTPLPTAEAILRLATPIFVAGLAKPASEAMPIYIRNRVALTTLERAAGQRL